MFMKASQKMLGVRRTSSPFLDLLGSGGAVGQPAQLQLHLTRKPEWGQDLLLKLHARRVADQAHPQGPIHLAPRRASAEPRPRGCSGLGEPRPALPSF